jgi:hypothetical protein
MTITMKKTSRDSILYLTIALAIVGIVGLVARYEDAHGLPIRMPIPPKPFALAVSTAVVFGYAIQARRKAWHSIRFWVLLSGLLVVYVPLQWLLIQCTGARVIPWAASAGIELFLLLFILEKLLPQEHHRAK